MIRLKRNYQQSLCGCGHSRPFFNLAYRMKFRFKLVLVSFLSLFYNDHLSRAYVFDTLMEPAFWFVDSFAKVLGPLFVVGVVVLKTSVVAIAYIVGLPYYWEHKVWPQTKNCPFFKHWFRYTYTVTIWIPDSSEYWTVCVVTIWFK